MAAGTNAGNLWVRLGLDRSNFTSGLKSAQGEAQGFGGVMKNAFSTMVGFAGYNGFASIVNGLKNAASAGIGYNATVEDSSVAWETLLGSQEKATTMLDKIQQFAAKTPFDKMGVDQMAKYLNNAGLEGDALFEQLTKFGDMGGAFNIQGDSLKEVTRQYSQVKQSGVAYTEDLNILADRGIPIYKAIADQLGINVSEVKKWASEGKISADIYQGALDGIAAGVAGGMDKQSKNWNGMVSTAKDSMGQIAGLMSEDLFAKLKDGLVIVQGKLDAFGQALESGGFSAAMKTLLPDGLVDGMTTLGSAIGAVFGWIMNNGPVITPIIAGLGTAFAAYKLAVLASIIVTELQGVALMISSVSALGLTGAMEALSVNNKLTAASQWILNAAMSANPLAIVVLAAVALVGAIIYLWNTNEGFRNALIAAWTAIKGFFAGIPAFFSGLWQSVVSTTQNLWNGLMSFIGGIPAKLYSLATNMIQNVKNGLASINLFDMGTNMIQGLINGIKNMATNVVNAAKGVVSDAVSAAKNLLGIKSPSKVFMEIGGYVGEGLAIGVDDSGDMVKKSMAGLSNIATGSMTVGLNSKLSGFVNGTAATQNTVASTSSNSNNDRPLEIVFKVGNTEFGRAVVNSINALTKQEGRLAIEI